MLNQQDKLLFCPRKKTMVTHLEVCHLPVKVKPNHNFSSGTRLSLDAIKRRLQTSNKYTKDKFDEDQKPPLFCADIVLQIPNVVMKPSLDDLQSSLNKAVQVILKASMDIPQWEHLIMHQKQQQKVGQGHWLCCYYK